MPLGPAISDVSNCPFAHVAITQLVSDILSYGLNDKKMVEMTAFEERGLLTREVGHADDYP
jgi:hypothetical protein